MNIKAQIAAHLAGQAEPKRGEMREVHRRVLRASPGCRLWHSDGKDEKGKTVSNPTIGYGLQTIVYADGKAKEFFRIGLSANATGISVYVLGIKDKKLLAKKFGKRIGGASVTGYCIRFRTLKDIDVDVLEEAIRFGFAEGASEPEKKRTAVKKKAKAGGAKRKK